MGDVPRRVVLGTAIATAAAATVSALVPVFAGAAPVKRLSRRTYAKHIGKTFTAVTGRTKHRVRLVRIGKPAVPSLSSDTCFTLVFAPVGAEIPERIYSIRRSGVVTHSLLLSSLGSDGLMQAVVNSAR